MAPIYEKVAKAFQNEPNCVVANLDADNAAHKEIAGKYDVKGFPTLKFFMAEDKSQTIPYEGERSEQALIDFLNLHCGTKRAAGGALVKKKKIVGSMMKSQPQHFSPFISLSCLLRVESRPWIILRPSLRWVRVWPRILFSRPPPLPRRKSQSKKWFPKCKKCIIESTLTLQHLTLQDTPTTMSR